MHLSLGRQYVVISIYMTGLVEKKLHSRLSISMLQAKIISSQTEEDLTELSVNQSKEQMRKSSYELEK